MTSNKRYTCPIDFTIGLIGSKWSMWVLWALLDGPKRFGELRRSIPNITEKILVEQLKKFEKNHIIIRTEYMQIPPKVIYELSEHGRSLEEIMILIRKWGENHLDIQEN